MGTSKILKTPFTLTTVTLIVGLLFLMLCALAYLFYSKYRLIMTNITDSNSALMTQSNIIKLLMLKMKQQMGGATIKKAVAASTSTSNTVTTRSIPVKKEEEEEEEVVVIPEPLVETEKITMKDLEPILEESEEEDSEIFTEEEEDEDSELFELIREEVEKEIEEEEEEEDDEESDIKIIKLEELEQNPFEKSSFVVPANMAEDEKEQFSIIFKEDEEEDEKDCECSYKFKRSDKKCSSVIYKEGLCKGHYYRR